MRPTIVTAMFCLLAGAAPMCGGQNVYPDPGFEVTGETGVARSGTKAGHLAVEARNHWAAIGGRIDVQPFARYRVTEWVRARVGSGTFFAPYCYEWDNYEWAFVSSHPIASSGEWVRTETTFISPHKTMYVHPLAYIEAENGEAWVDDIVVEKVKSPGDAMAELLKKPNPSEDEKRLIARWHLARGSILGADDVLRASSGLTRADIATSTAATLRKPQDRLPYLIDMIAYGGPSYNDGIRRFREIARGIEMPDVLTACAEALRRNPGLDRAGTAVRLIIADLLPSPISLGTVDEARRRLRMFAGLGAMVRSLPAGLPALAEVKQAMKQVEQAESALAAHQAELGHCVIRIGGKTVTPQTHAIVVPDKPTPQEEYAAKDLRHHLELMTGGAVPIVPEAKRGKAVPLYVGRCKTPPDLHVDLAGLGVEGIHVKTSGPAILFAGNRRGVLYAVYTFLQDDLGCRWFTPDCATWPKSGTIDITHVDRRYAPPLEYRAGDYPVLKPGDFAVRLRMNGRVCEQSEEQGGTVGVHSLAHTFAALVPPERYFKEHPEYFSLVNGKRQSGYAQLCLTNPDVLRLAIEGVRKWIEAHPNQSVFSVSQNDTFNFCECEKCAAVAAEEGSQAGPMLRFVNAVADAIAKDHPNIAIETLAYQYTRKPPKITRPRPNVIICLCSIECCFIHPLGEDAFNKSFVDDIVGWSRICNRLWIWDYVINYAHSICPFPNLNVLRPNIRFFIGHGVKGIYEESCYYTKGSELQELRNYLLAQALWNPDCDTGKATGEFCAAYYGAAGPFVRRYIDLIHTATQQNAKLHVAIYTHPRDYVTPEMISQSQALFDHAVAAVKDDPVRLHRVEVARLPIIYAAITLATAGALSEHGDRLAQEGGTDVSALAQEFERIARAEGVTMVREGGPDALLDAWLASIPRRPRDVTIEHIGNPTIQLSVLPALGGRIWRMRYGGRDLLTLAGAESSRSPLDDGYEEYSESGYHSAGWSDPFTVKERSERSITLEANLRSGLRMTRRIEVDAAKPLVTITSVLTNTGTETSAACLRVHPEFAVSSTAQTSVRILSVDGSWRNIDLANPADLNAEKDLWLREGEVPNGAWEIVDKGAGLTISNRVQRSMLGQCLLNWSGAGHRVNLELFSPETKLAPGQALTLEHTYEVAAAPAR